ncbi:hypothetical protein ABG067_007336 [Albugo candida]
MWAELCEAWKQIQVTTFLKEKELNEPILTDDLELVLDRYGIQKQNCGLMGPACSCVCGESYCSKHCRDKALEEYHILLCPRILPHEMDQLNALMRQRVPLSNLNANSLAEEYSPTAVLHAYANLNDDYSLIVKLVARIVCDFIRTGNLNSGLAVDGFHRRSMSDVLLKLEGRFQSISTSTNASAYNVLLKMHQSFVEAVRWSLQFLEETNKLNSKNAEETFKMCSQVFSFEFFIALFESIGMNTISMEIDHPILALIDILDPHELAIDKALEEYHILLCPRILPHEMDQLNALMRQRVPLSNLNANNLAEEYSPTAVLHAYVNLNDDYSLIVKLVARIVCDFIRTGNLNSGLAVDGFHQRSMSDVLLKLEGRFQSISTSTNASAYNVLLEMHQSFVEAVRWSLQVLEETNKLKSKNAEETFKMCSQVFSFEFFIALFESIGMNTISMEIDHPFLALIDILDPHELAMSFSASQGQSAINSDENLLRVRNVLKVLPCLKQHQESVTQLQGITGSAFYSLICTLNRSCEPNVTVLYTKNCDAHVVAIRDVAEGEELCIADVDVDLDVDARDIVLHECDPKCGCTCVHAGQMVVV